MNEKLKKASIQQFLPMNLCIQASTEYSNLETEFFGHFYKKNHLQVIWTLSTLNNPSISW